MRRLTSSLFALLAIALTSSGQTIPQQSNVAGIYLVSPYDQWSDQIAVGNSTTGSGSTIVLTAGSVKLPDGRVVVPFSTSVPLLVGVGANAETVTPTAVSGCTPQSGPASCTITANFTKTHTQYETVFSGSAGVQDAIADAGKQTAAVVVIDSPSAPNPATPTPSNVAILDYRTAGYIYLWNGGSSSSVQLGVSGGAGNPCTTTALSLQFNNAGAFGCVADMTYSGHTITVGASGILALTAGASVTGITAAMIPTLNQNTTGSAAKWTTARTLAGNSVDGSANVAFANKFIVEGTTDSGLSSAFFLGSLATGLLKNTTTTGVPSVANAADIDALFTGAGKCYLFKGTSPGSNDGCDTPSGSMVYPGAGVPNSTGSAWGTSYAVGTSASDLVQLNGSAQLPAVSAALLTNFPTFNQNTTGTAGGLTGCTTSTAGSVCYWNGTAWAVLAGNNSGTQFLQETSSGVPSWASALSNPMTTLGDVMYGGSGGAAARLAGPTGPNGVPSYVVDIPSGGAATAEQFVVAGVPVNNNSESTCASQTLNILDRATAIFCNGTSTATFTLPVHTTSGFGSNFPFVVLNNNTGNMTLTPTTDTIDNGTLLPGWADFLYNNASGNWQTAQFPQYAAFGSTCAGGVTWSTSSGFGCLPANATFTNATTAVSANSCSASAATVTMTGVTTSMAFSITPSTDVSASTGWGSSGGLVIDAWPTANTLNYKICNQTASSITPAAVTWNVSAR